jgi:tetratricopeptide (TPR) repeat protein
VATNSNASAMSGNSGVGRGSLCHCGRDCATAESSRLRNAGRALPRETLPIRGSRCRRPRRSRTSAPRFCANCANALIASHGYGAPETTAAFARAREIVGDDPEAPERSSVAYGLWVGSYMRCELTVMREAAAAFISDAEGRPAAPEASVAHRINGVTKWLSGDFSDAKSDYEKAIAIFDPARDGELAFRFGQDPGVGAWAYQSLTLWPLGQADHAVQSIEAATARASGLTHIGTVAYAKMHATMFEMLRGDFTKAAPHAKALAELARERWEMRRGLASIHEQKVVIFDGVLRCALAVSDAHAGDFGSALSQVEQAVSISERTGARWYDAEILRTRGEILFKQKPAEPVPSTTLKCGTHSVSFSTVGTLGA